MNRAFLTRFAWLSIGAALLTMGLKTAAYLITGSVGLLSDAVESLVNLFGGIMALAMLTIAARPADEDHAYGHGKAEYFSSGLEGGLILVAAIGIAVAAGLRLITPRPLEELNLGLGLSVVASVVNLVVAWVILRAGRKHRSITLEANARHLLTDVWTSVGVIAGIGLVLLTGWQWLDPVVALLVAANIAWTSIGIMRRSVGGLMDISISTADQAAVRKVFAPYEATGLKFHALRTRQSGMQRFISVHVLVPGDWTVHRGHELLEKIEADIRSTVPDAVVFTHLESLDDPASWEDEALERDAGQR
jgi:cation diffusion facilitator family transporter